MPGAIDHQGGQFLVKPGVQALCIGACVTLQREVRDKGKKQTNRDVFFHL